MAQDFKEDKTIRAWKIPKSTMVVLKFTKKNLKYFRLTKILG